jgi:hypothetical protein
MKSTSEIYYKNIWPPVFLWVQYVSSIFMKAQSGGTASDNAMTMDPEEDIYLAGTSFLTVFLAREYWINELDVVGFEVLTVTVMKSSTLWESRLVWQRNMLPSKKPA